jgi:signal transduction histidine kinase
METERTIRLLQDLLDLARADSGYLHLRWDVCLLNESVAEVASMASMAKECKDSGGGVLTSVIGEAEYSSYGKEAATKTRPRDIKAVGNRGTGRNHY